ncbi:histone-lysine N-methyltransferase, H3 lysine-9 specific SUVH5-like [Rosa rugosa]|uniref:histone-lysine N-methyltransferase, H3 lysine-9 specific SUVH5-like n=1 Tax=Rosa rugosa TaxID=74645 RepID=UPI002B41231A|nr:histone-lysine N-methyltransferase, H3 lysine-9 specific SUVH5-like [Rosa rugosa]XP_062028823.1 histone-lysine N-methyltransferase, H3 lysine-9 specific SUVH5-like [Rosa rugosa]
MTSESTAEGIDSPTKRRIRVYVSSAEDMGGRDTSKELGGRLLLPDGLDSVVSTSVEVRRNFLLADGQERGVGTAVEARKRVKDTLMSFSTECCRLMQKGDRRFHDTAYHIVKNRGQFVNTDKIFGNVPGVKVGDKFRYRVQLRMIGLHAPLMNGIDYRKYRGKLYATSIVASGDYEDELQERHSIVYVGQGAGAKINQVLEGANLALANSIDLQNPVRVIRYFMSLNKKRIFYYDGLYKVQSYREERDHNGKSAYKFKLHRDDES